MLSARRKRKQGKGNGKSHWAVTGLLLAAAMAACTACGSAESGRAAVNAEGKSDGADVNSAESNASGQGAGPRKISVYEAADAAVQEKRASVQEAAEEAAVREAEEAEAAAQEKEEPEGGFHVSYQGHEAESLIELRHCDCVYDADDIQIYAKYLYWLMVPEAFPCDQYVLYIRTPQEELQLYPVKDFLVDAERGFLYTKIAGDDGFESVRCMSFTEQGSPIADTGREIFNAKQAEEMLRGAYQENMGNGADSGQPLFSNITVELTEVKEGAEDAAVLKGEVGGIGKATGQRYFADWEISLPEGTLSAKLCVLKQYDPVEDKEVFAACSSVFDRIEQGSWSDVREIEEQYLWGMDADEWIRMDVNGDGLPELVGGWTIEELPDYEDSRKVEISIIFAYQDGMAEVVYTDVNDGMEFLFITAKGDLVYEWGVSGGPCTNVFRRCTFDLKWNKEYLDTLVRYRFPEGLEEETSEKMQEYYREYYPDTYGVGGGGVYCLRERRKTEEELKHNEDGKYTVREYLTEEEFLEMYEEWTGWDFYQAQWVY